MFAWKAIPPSEEFVALGMLVTRTADPPLLDAMRCVHKKWCMPSLDVPTQIWASSGLGGREGSFWAVSSLRLLHVIAGHRPPGEDEICYDILVDKWPLLDGGEPTNQESSRPDRSARRESTNKVKTSYFGSSRSAQPGPKKAD